MTELSTDRRFHNLTTEQIQTLDQVLTEVIPIHGRGNFPTLEVKPKDIIHAVRSMLIEKQIEVRDVRLNGSTASHVLVMENGTSYKDLDIIFGVEISKQEDFQLIKEVVLGCLVDFLPRRVNKEKITPLTMKEAYVQKMVKVFTEHDRWSLISLSNNSGKNVELKFVNSLRRQFEFSVDSFQIILDSILESYLEAEKGQMTQSENLESDTSAPEASEPLRSSAESNYSTPPVITCQDQTKEVEDISIFIDSSCCQEEAKKKDKQWPLPMSGTESKAFDQTEDMEVNEPEPDLKVQMENEAEPLEKFKVKEKTVSVIEKETDSPILETKRQMKTLQTNEKALNLDVEVESSENFESAVAISDSPSPAETALAKDPATLKLPCNPSFQSYSCLAQNDHDSFTEFPFPPPAKKSFKKSQMVVLKHSSPKPPRKMSKKVTSGLVSLAKARLASELPFLLNPPSGPTKINPEESIPISNKVPGPVCPESPINTSHDKGQFEKLEVPTTACQNLTVQENSTGPHEAECLQKNSNESKPPTLQTPTPFREPETAELGDKETNIFSQISPMEPQVPSNQLLEPISQAPDSGYLKNPAPQLSELNSLVPNSTVQRSNSTVQVLDFAVQVPEPVAQEPQHGVQTTEPVAQSFAEHIVPVTYLIPQVPQFAYQAPCHATLLPETAAQPPVSNSQGLPSAQDGEQQTGCEPERQETETSPTPKELPDIKVVAESMYGDFEQAMDHLRYRLIATRKPEEIRGGGLLKYSNLLVRDFKPASETEIKTLERYMCSRFFIDFPDVNEQQRKIESYLRNHFIGEEKSKYDYLMTLRRVVNESTVCLMGHERRQTLNMITILALKVLGEQNIIPNTTNVTCYYQPAPYLADHNFSNYYISHSQPPLIYHPYPLHLHIETGLV